jgi:hypothetical protein
VAALALAAATAMFVTHHSGGGTGHPPASAVAGSPRSATGGTRPASNASAGNSASASQAPITLAEIFPDATVTVASTHFTQVAATVTDDCSLTARGAFAAALTYDGCQRVVRATYVDSAKRYAVTAGVAALPTHVAAYMVDHARRFGPDVWFEGLDGPAGSGASAISQTVGVGYDLVAGRFIVYALATYSDRHNPTGQAAEIRTLTTMSQSFATMAQQQLIGTGNA